MRPEELIGNLKGYIERQTRYFTRDLSLRDDLEAESLVIAASVALKYESIKSEDLYRIAKRSIRNKMIDFMRRRKVYRERVGSYRPGERTRDPYREAETREILDFIASRVQPEHSETFNLMREGFSNEEVGCLLDVSARTIARRRKEISAIAI